MYIYKSYVVNFKGTLGTGRLWKRKENQNV